MPLALNRLAVTGYGDDHAASHCGASRLGSELSWPGRTAPGSPAGAGSHRLSLPLYGHGAPGPGPPAAAQLTARFCHGVAEPVGDSCLAADGVHGSSRSAARPSEATERLAMNYTR
eukprot:757699-Hanusia_phi.AAC.4